MGRSFRFLHCGDVHLGAGRQVHPERYLDLFRVFQEVTEAATESSVDALVISGDLFDVKEPDVETLARAVACFKALKARRPELPIVAIEGNHDMRKRARGAHRNERGVLDILSAAGLITLLRPEINEDDTLDFSNAVLSFPEFDLAVVGLGYWREHVPARFQEAMKVAATRSESRVIVLAHLMIMHDGLEPYHGSATLGELQPVPDKVRYIGLGHGHSKIDASSRRHGGVFYSPGSLEFVHVRNTHKPVDSRGFFDVTLGNDAVATHRPTRTKRPFVHIKVDLNALEPTSFDAVRDAVRNQFEAVLAAESAELRPICSVQLEGRIRFPAASFRTSVIQNDLVEHFGAIQTFVRRGLVADDTGAPIGFDIEGGYEEAVSTVITDLVRDAHEALGLPADDKVLQHHLLEAIREPDAVRDALENCRAHLASFRAPRAVDRELVVQLGAEGLSTVACVQRALDEVTDAKGLGVALHLTGRAPLTSSGALDIPDVLALEQLVVEQLGASRCSVRVSESVFGAEVQS